MSCWVVSASTTAFSWVTVASSEPSRVAARSRSPSPHHHHVVCPECGWVIEDHSPLVEPWVSEVGERLGGNVVDHPADIEMLCRSQMPSHPRPVQLRKPRHRPAPRARLGSGPCGENRRHRQQVAGNKIVPLDAHDETHVPFPENRGRWRLDWPLSAVPPGPNDHMEQMNDPMSHWISRFRHLVRRSLCDRSRTWTESWARCPGPWSCG